MILQVLSKKLQKQERIGGRKNEIKGAVWWKNWRIYKKINLSINFDNS